MHPRLTDLDTLKLFLGKAGVEPARSSGQNFLISEEVIEGIVACLDGAPKRVTELGAGTGVLTQALAMSGFAVKAIERDTKLAAALPDALPSKLRGEVDILVGDLKETAWSWDEPYALVGNIPYNLSGLILRRATQLQPSPERIVLLVQQEVAERVVAAPPQMSLIGLAMQLWGKPELMMRVPPHCFWPAPQVHSAVILITPHPDMLPLEIREGILAVAKKFFQGKRKQMGGQMKRLFGLDEQAVAQVFTAVGITPLMRPQEVGVEQWKNLAELLRR